jgi:hypothetical protein
MSCLVVLSFEGRRVHHLLIQIIVAVFGEGLFNECLIFCILEGPTSTIEVRFRYVYTRSSREAPVVYFAERFDNRVGSGTLLVARRVYFQSLAPYWSHVGYILSLWHPIGRTYPASFHSCGSLRDKF